ncbi:MAG: hypothetical protein KC994_23595, partial [Candidatus Omnitrophica bacterium]|nr:hypothetical protein [Candidatus Omnitrophota bacterium]
VPDASTLPGVVDRESGGKFAVYNYGRGGFGPGQMYTQLGIDSLFEDVEPREGYAVYCFIGDHLNRVTPYTVHRLALHYGKGTFFDRKQTGELVGPLFFTSETLPNPVKRYHWWVEVSPTCRLLLHTVPWTLKTEEEAIGVAARVIVESCRKYRERFNGEFIVLIWPRVSVAQSGPKTPFAGANRLGLVSESGIEELTGTLEEEGIRVLRVPPMPDAEAAVIHPRDEHPSEEEYEWVGRHLTDFLEGL